MSKILGIDLGTTNSAMAVVEGGEPKIVENKEGSRTTPSVVALNKSNERLVGVVAKRQAVTNSENTVFSIKRLMGRNFAEKEVQKEKKLYPFEVREKKDGGVEIKMGDKWHTPPEISAMILQKLKQDAEDKLGEEIKEAIITCPAYFDDSQRKATKVAGEIAGLEVKRVINEPTAAALAYGLTKKKNQQILVYDFGGGTFDVSILDVSEDTVEVKATGGDSYLGGDDFDQKIIDWVIGNYKKDEGIDLSKDKLALQRIKEAAEKAKIELSSAQETEINLPFITSGKEGPKHLLYKLKRAQLEQMTSEYVDRSIKITKNVLSEANLKPEEIEEIVFVGGQTRMPEIQKRIKEIFNKEPNKSINPDEVVAIGAAIQGGIMQGDVRDVLLLDVVPLSLGIETMGGVNTKLIEKNTTVPTSKTQTFSTAADNQTSVEINVIQGERPLASDNKSLGKFILDGIPPAPRGAPQIEVKFDIDANGILNVSAKDKASGKSQSIRIEGSAGLSEEEIEKMKKDAKAHKDEDQKKQKLIEARNKAENLIYTSEKTIKEAGDKVDENSKKKVEEKIGEVKSVLESDNIEEVNAKTEELNKTIQEVGAAMYKASQEQGGGGNATGDETPESGGGNSEKNAEEGDYKEEGGGESKNNGEEDENKEEKNE